MTEPINLPPPTTRELAAWRKEFETRGREAIRLFVYGYGGKEVFSEEKHQAAIEWLRKRKSRMKGARRRHTII